MLLCSNGDLILNETSGFMTKVKFEDAAEVAFITGNILKPSLKKLLFTPNLFTPNILSPNRFSLPQNYFFTTPKNTSKLEILFKTLENTFYIPINFFSNKFFFDLTDHILVILDS